MSQPAILLGQNISSQNAKADSLIKAKDFSGAITIYKQMLIQHPEDVDIRLYLGKAYFLSGDYEKAEIELSGFFVNLYFGTLCLSSRGIYRMCKA